MTGRPDRAPAEIAFAPDVPAGVRRAVEHAARTRPQVLKAAEPPLPTFDRNALARGLRATGFLAVGVTVLAPVSYGILIATQRHAAQLPGVGTGHTTSAGGFGVGFLCVLGALAAAGVVLSWRAARPNAQEVADAKAIGAAAGRYVLPGGLSDEAVELLYRAQRATARVLATAVHCDGLLDDQRNQVVLPAQVWELAQHLAEHSDLAGRQPEQAAGGRVVPLLKAHRAALAASLAGLERRVTVLEDYAEQAVLADRRYVELQQVEQLERSGAGVLDLLARTAADDLAVAEVEGMTVQAAVLAEAFTTALQQAKDAAVVAMPAKSA
ncbi:hypothetical protein [Kitasatospora sp. NPDC085879]|uniref:hypothetical protein n=1 Tax=Kitasatospora sp. NPDC085879 TaxID=3154769 RepID=UPI00343E6990